MIMDSLDEYLETVAGYIFDNDKLVTYKWLSKELEVHVNIAKQILWAFWQRYKEEKSFECSFLLMGVLHDSGMRVEVLKEKDLSRGKEKFAKIVSEHVYSLQKVLPEVQILGLAENGSIKHSAIKCLEYNVRNDKEMHMLRWGAVSTEVQLITQEKVESPPKPTNEAIQKSPEKKSVGTKKSTQKKGFDNLFGKTGNKQKSPSSTSSSTEKMEENASSQIKLKSSKATMLESPKKLAKKGGLDVFLQQGKNSGKVTNPVPLEIKESTNSTTNENTEKKITLENNNKQKKNKFNTRGKKRNRSKEVTAGVKKRKRITIESDSSDTELSDEEQEEGEELPSAEKISPVKACSPSPPKIKLEGGKRKVLKLVDKTFEEDGYFVTKKVHVYESCSEDEPEVTEAKKSVAPELHPEKKGKKTNTKQTNLMNYFRKS
ncbi:DNA polymerase delta subunit 3-like [Hylaeus anthracinus]|uniref:DNA polymerase delta subunit 3-like n=1 Tax=Hylaeus anthracinus TaxID=313031 RepID=UPI0023B95A80|nr:DNA polymerase delta subunit 3-like [Hylaeus anthracinus]